MVQAPWTGTQSPTCPSPANFILLPSSWACSPVPPCRCLCQEPPSQIPLFLSLFSSLEAPLTVSTVCTQPLMNLRTLGLSVRSGHTPAAAKPHAHVCGFYVGRHTRFPYIPPPSERPSRGPRYVSTSKSLSRNSRWDSGSRHGNRWAFMPSPAISAGTQPPAGLPGDLFPMIGSCGEQGGFPNLPLLFSPVLLSLAPSMARLPGWDRAVFGRGLPWTRSRDWSQISHWQLMCPWVNPSFLCTSMSSSVRCLPYRVALGLGQSCSTYQVLI